MSAVAMGFRHDRMIPLRDLSCYPGSEWLDKVLFLPWSKNTRRRLWLMVPESSPTIAIGDTILRPQRVSDRQPRWVDYDIATLPIVTEPNPPLGEFYQLRVRDMGVSECNDSHLVIATNTDLTLEGCSLEEAEEKLWGLSRCDAGATTMRPSRVTAGSDATFTVRYVAGAEGLPAGALVRFAVPKAFSRPQTEAPDGPGFASIVQADCDVSIVALGDSLESHDETDIICQLHSPLAPSEGFSLRYSTDRTYIFPTEQHETDRRYWYSHLPPLAAAAAVSESSPFVCLEEANGHVFEVVPGPSERLHLFLPGRRFASEELDVRGTFTDHYRNAPPSGTVDADVELWLLGNGERISLGTAAGHFVARHRFEIPLPQLSPGVYRVVASRTDGLDDVARSNPLEVIEECGECDRLYWGEIHGHTEMSDGSGDYSELYRHAREEGCLDFAAAADHAEYITDNQWLWMQDVTNSWNQPGRFVTLVGHEWEGEQRDRNVYTSRARLKLFRGNHPSSNSLDVVWSHFSGDEQVAGGPHATMAHDTVWEHHNPSVERFAEIYSMWGASDFRDSPLVPAWIEEGRGLTVNDILQEGAKLGFTGGGDCHEGHCGFSQEDPEGQGVVPHTFASILLYRCGMTAAIMPSLDRTCLMQALRNRRTYATTGARILLHFTAAGLPMGSIGVAKEVECCATVHGVERISRMEIIKDGNLVWSKELSDLDAAITWRDPVPVSSEHYYYLHVVQVDGQRAWSSPIWIRPPLE